MESARICNKDKTLDFRNTLRSSNCQLLISIESGIRNTNYQSLLGNAIKEEDGPFIFHISVKNLGSMFLELIECPINGFQANEIV